MYFDGADHTVMGKFAFATRGDNELLAQNWRHLARSYEFVENLQRFLSETDRNRKELNLPEVLAVGEEQPVAPASKPIIRRPRVKQASFKERLLKSAQDAREQAALLPPGVARDRLLQAAHQSEYRHVDFFARIASDRTILIPRS